MPFTSSRLLLPMRKKIVRSLSTIDEYAFEMASSSVRVGRGVTKEVGFDAKAIMGTKDNVCVVTDKNLVNLPPFKVIRTTSLIRSTSFD